MFSANGSDFGGWQRMPDAERFKHIPKPLINVRGLSLAERSVAQLQNTGIDRFVVVLGANKDPVRAHFESIAKRRRCTIDFIFAKDWELGNGYSAAAAESLVGNEPFLLTMVDHLLSHDLILKLLSNPPPPEGIALAVDYNKSRIFDEDDLTKVRIKDNHIAEIGKDLERWDAGDTGLFYCTPELFRGLSRARVRGRFSLTDGVRECLTSGVKAVDVTGCRWVRRERQQRDHRRHQAHPPGHDSTPTPRADAYCRSRQGACVENRRRRRCQVDGRLTE